MCNYFHQGTCPSLPSDCVLWHGSQPTWVLGRGKVFCVACTSNTSLTPATGMTHFQELSALPQLSSTSGKAVSISLDPPQFLMEGT